jgi:hypothetical protein
MLAGALDCLGLDCKFDTALESTGADTIYTAPL